jgi:hypothetical protein
MKFPVTFPTPVPVTVNGPVPTRTLYSYYKCDRFLLSPPTPYTATVPTNRYWIIQSLTVIGSAISTDPGPRAIKLHVCDDSYLDQANLGTLSTDPIIEVEMTGVCKEGDRMISSFYPNAPHSDNAYDRAPGVVPLRVSTRPIIERLNAGYTITVTEQCSTSNDRFIGKLSYYEMDDV